MKARCKFHSQANILVHKFNMGSTDGDSLAVLDLRFAQDTAQAWFRCKRAVCRDLSLHTMQTPPLQRDCIVIGSDKKSCV